MRKTSVSVLTALALCGAALAQAAPAAVVVKDAPLVRPAGEAAGAPQRAAPVAASRMQARMRTMQVWRDVDRQLRQARAGGLVRAGDDAQGHVFLSGGGAHAPAWLAAR